MRLTASRLTWVAVATLCLAPATALAAAPPLQNGGFESNLDDWTADDALVGITDVFYHRDGSGNVLRGDDGVVILPPYTAQEGTFFAVLSADGQFADPDTNIVKLSQTFSTAAGRFSGFAAFSAGDYAPYFDFGYLKITGMGLSRTLFSSDVGAVGDYGQTGWRTFGVNLLAGDYTLEAGIANVGDDFQASFLLLDGFSIGAVPEPATWALMLSGFFSLGAMLRRRRLVPAKARR